VKQRVLAVYDPQSLLFHCTKLLIRDKNFRVKPHFIPPFTLLSSLLVSVAQASPETLPEWSVSFESVPLGAYSETQLQSDWPAVEWTQGLDRIQIVQDSDIRHGHAIEVFYPKGSVGPNQGGAQFVVPIPPAEQYTLNYDFRISEDFDFRLGGKLPGLTSGGSAYTGGHKPDQGQGWSARFMWREHGQMVLYLYSIDMKGKWGDDHPLQMPLLEKGRWYHVSQRITLNAPDARDAHIEVWVDGALVLDLKQLRLRIGDKGPIDTFYFSTFFGGNSVEWGPHNDSHIRFDNFTISRQ